MSSSESESIDQQLVDERQPLHQLAPRALARSGRWSLASLSVGSTGADGQALLLLELDEPAEVGELGVVVVRLGEPAVDAGGRRCGPARRRGRRPRASPPARRAARSVSGSVCSRVLTTMTVGRACCATVSGSTPNSAPVVAAVAGATAAAPMTTSWAVSASRMIAQRRRRPRRAAVAPARRHALPHERRQRALGLRADDAGDVRRNDVHHVDAGVEVAPQRGREAQRQLGVRAAAHRRQDALARPDAALLDDRDVARRLAHDLVDGRR